MSFWPAGSVTSEHTPNNHRWIVELCRLDSLFNVQFCLWCKEENKMKSTLFFVRKNGHKYLTFLSTYVKCYYICYYCYIVPTLIFPIDEPPLSSFFLQPSISLFFYYFIRACSHNHWFMHKQKKKEKKKQKMRLWLCGFSYFMSPPLPLPIDCFCILTFGIGFTKWMNVWAKMCHTLFRSDYYRFQ